MFCIVLPLIPLTRISANCVLSLSNRIQVRNQDFMCGGATETKVNQTTEMYFLANSF